MKFNSIIDALFYNSYTKPNKDAFIFLHDGENKKIKVTYQELSDKVVVFSESLLNEFKRGDRVLLCYPPGLEYIVAFYACLSKGLIAVPIYPPDARSNNRIRYIINDCGAKLALTSKEIFVRIKESGFEINSEGLSWKSTDILNEKMEITSLIPCMLYPDEIAFLQYTSGSTGKPKGVMVSHGNMIANSALIKQSYCHDDSCLQVSWLPPYHDMGLVGNIIQPMFSGITTVHMSPASFLKKPVRWLKAISEYGKAGFVTSGGPNFSYEICCNSIQDYQMEGLDLRNWRVAYSGAEPIRAETLRNFSEKFKKCGFSYKSFYPVYGLAEVALMASAGDIYAEPLIKRFNKEAIKFDKVEEAPNSGSKEYIELIGCGQNLDEHKISIVNPQTLNVCKNNEIGEIWIKGPSVAKGYWNKSEATIKYVYAFTNDTYEGPFLRTGDLGFIHLNQLFVTGRLKETIRIKGQNFYPQEIEKVIEKANECIRPGCGTIFSTGAESKEELIVVYELHRKCQRNIDHQTIKSTIRKAVSKEFDLSVNSIIFIETSSFPKTTSGKLQRLLVKQRYLKNELKIIDSKNECKITV